MEQTPSPTTQDTEAEIEFFNVHCPICGSKIGKYGTDSKGTSQPRCRKCRAVRLVQVSATGKLLVELLLPGVYSPPEKIQGVNRAERRRAP